MSVRRLLPILLLALGACKRPPAAPEGLDASATYLVREFFSDDATFQAGVQGFLTWYDEEGEDLIDAELSIENTGSFSVGDLSDTDVAALPLDATLVVDKTASGDEVVPRDVTAAAGVVSLAEMDCSVQEAEELLARPDQDTVFCGDWQGYARTYSSDRTTFEGAWSAEGFSAINEAQDPYAGAYDFDAYADAMLFTDNDVDPTPVLGGLADIETYPMDLVLRHGVYQVGEEEREAMLILTFTRAAAWGVADTNALIQSYSIEINVSLGNGKTLRMLTVWAEPKGGGIPADSPTALNFALRKAKASSDRLSGICAGTIPIDDTESCEI